MKRSFKIAVFFFIRLAASRLDGRNEFLTYYRHLYKPKYTSTRTSSLLGFNGGLHWWGPDGSPPSVRQLSLRGDLDLLHLPFARGFFFSLIRRMVSDVHHVVVHTKR